MGKCYFSAMCVVCTVVATASLAMLIGIWTFQLLPSTVVPAASWDSYRLPATLLPDTYHVSLWLTPDPHGVYVFTGNSTVIFRCVKETDLILIHSNKLSLTADPTLTTLSGAPAPSIASTWMQETTQYLVIQLNSKLTAGESYQLYTEFQGELANDLGGFYRSEYSEDGVKRTVVASQMHPTHARKTFPCFDEPAMKAFFYITLYHDRGTVALSNAMETWDTVDTVVDGTAVTVTRFKPTESMSPYLLALVITDYTNVQSREDTLVRIWARRTAVANGLCVHALQLTERILHFLQDFCGVTYPLSKLDQLAVPDLHHGAVENWGLITYRETDICYEPHISSNRDQWKTASVMAHELAHMWFGGLVTLSWWNDVWLTEGFATYMSYLGADYTEPRGNLKDLIVLNDIHRVFAVDALASSHPLSSKEEDIMKPEQINELFDTISYSKGALVLRMMSEFLTNSIFVGGLRTYLQTFAYKNTVTSNLWDHLQRAVDANRTVLLPGTVSDIMDRWVLQAGFPVVSIDTTTGQLTQQRFLLDPDSTGRTHLEFNHEWFIPINWMKSGVEQKPTWLLQRSENHSDMKTAGEKWVLLNINLTGYYRVNYDPENWKRILQQLRTDPQVIPEVNRAQIVDDAFNLARAGMIPVAVALNTTEFLSRERSYMPWESALFNLEYFLYMFEQTDVYANMQKYLKKQVTPLFEHFKTNKTGWMQEPDENTDQYNQDNAIRVACRAEEDGCLGLSWSWFSQWMADPAQNPINPNLRSTVYCSAIAAGGAEEWDFAWRMFKNTTIATEAGRLMSALACTKDTQLLESYLHFTLDPAKIRKQDATSVIVQVGGNKVGREVAWNFVRRNWKYIFTEYGAGSFSFPELIRGVTQAFSTQAQLTQLQQFQQDHSDVGFGPAALTLQQAVDQTKANVKWVAETLREVREWFSMAAA
ncbi:aminopeptidase N-like [Brachyhypopomus gauderio]|uniref:aminopeptidase N-like n=1 Tax=Brachyhypopomus gauderio TaxID=698409 RepID=UPI004042E78E